MIRVWVCFVALLLAPIALARSGNPLLILIQARRAGPAVDIHDYVHEVWIRWGPEDLDPSGNRLLSLFSGLNLHGVPRDYGFRPAVSGAWSSTNLASLRSRGYFDAVEANLGRRVSVLAGHDGNVTPSTLLLGLDRSGTSHVIAPEGLWPSGHVMVAEAVSWDDMAALERRTTGPVLVVEYPVPVGQRWSRAWLRGTAWPRAADELPAFRVTHSVPGLIPADQVGRLLVDPEVAQWVPKPSNWTGANRWMEQIGRAERPIKVAWAVFAIVLAIWGVRLVSDDRDSVLWQNLLPLFALMVPGFVLGGRFALRMGADNAPLAWAIGWLTLYAAWVALEFWRLRLGGVGSWTVLGLVGVAGCLVGDMTYSPFSVQLGPVDRFVSTEWLAASILGGGLFIRDRQYRIDRVDRIRGVEVRSIYVSPWVSALLLAPGFALMRSIWPLWNGAVLLTSSADRGRILFEHVVRFLASPAFLVGLFMIAAITIFAQGYASHRFRRTWEQNSSARTCLPYALVPLVGGLFVDGLLDAGWSVLLGLCFVWIGDTIRST